MPKLRNTKLIFASAMRPGLDTEAAHGKKILMGKDDIKTNIISNKY